MNPPRTIEWIGDIPGHVRIIDQTLLPTELAYRDCRTIEDVHEAIRMLRVRGAPAIGVAAAYGVVLGMQPGHLQRWNDDPMTKLREVANYLRSSRPTAVNLSWAVDRMERRLAHMWGIVCPTEWLHGLLLQARKIEEEDADMCRAIGQVGATLVKDGQGILTHCNAGRLATAGEGTALAVLYAAQRQGKKFQVFADETRPLLQGARLTAWELHHAGIDVTLICDSMAAQVMREGRIHLVIVGADRIARNGDTANKIGTYGIAVLARAHRIPFYVAAPSSTFDFDLRDGSEIPIEQRAPHEILEFMGKLNAPAGVQVYNPAFDVTPAELISGIVTENGIIEPVAIESIQQTLLRRP